MEEFGWNYFQPRRHNSMSVWQRGAQDRSVADHKHTIADLFEATSKLLISISRYLTTSGLETGTSTQDPVGERMKSEAERLYLWGFDMSVGSGRLDEVLSHKAEVREAIVATLCDLGNLLVLAARQGILQHCSSCRLAHDRLTHVLGRADRDHVNLDSLSTHDGGEGEEEGHYDLHNLPDEVDTYIICLLDISMAMSDLFGDNIHSSLDIDHESNTSDTEPLPPERHILHGGIGSTNTDEAATEQVLPVSPYSTNVRPSQQQRAATWHTSLEHSEVNAASDELRARQCIALRIAEMRESLNNADNDRLAGVWKARGARRVSRTAKRQTGVLHPLATGSHNVPVEYHSTQSSSTHWMVRMLRRPSKLTIPLSIAVGAARQRRVVRVQ